MKHTFIVSLAIVLSLFISTNAFADHDATGASTETHTSTSATGGTSGGGSGGAAGSTETTSATSATVAVPIKMEVEVETEHGVQTTTVKPDSSSSAMCGGKEMPKLECPSGYAVGCNTAVSQWACVKSAASADVRTGVSTGAGAAAGAMPVKYLDQDADDDGVTTILEDSIVKSAIYIKLGDVKGESEDDNAAASDVFIKLGGVDGESAKGDVPTEGQFEILIDSNKVRGWDPKTKEEVAKATPKLAEAVTTENDLALYVASQTEGDAAIESVSLNFTKIEFKYKSDAKLFGVIPFSLTQDVSLEGDVVNLKKPWYSFLFSGATDIDDLAAAAQATKDKGHKDEIEILSWSFGASNAGSMSAGSGGGAGKVNVASGDVNGDGTVRTFADVAAEFSALKEVMKASYDLKANKKI